MARVKRVIALESPHHITQRGNTHTGRPLTAMEFVRHLERRLDRQLAPRRGGRQPANRPEPGQMKLGF